uniref:Exonuclease 3'-5' domain containing 3 n=1 Tax=Salarias fasciatus TaxID=181472 RepID=A0A672IZ76_SALFA
MCLILPGLDPTVLTEELLQLWSFKDLQTLHIVAQHSFSKLSEPLKDLLTVLERCPGKQKGRSQTVSSHILLEFHTWMKEHPQHRALGLLTDTHPSFADNLINIYQLNSCDRATLKQHVLNLLALHNYKEICVPLVLGDKLALAESFVAGQSHLEQQLVALLDSWCHPTCSMEEIRKCVRTCLLCVIPTCGVPFFVVFLEMYPLSMTEENWCDHVQYVVGDDLELQVHLVTKLEQYCGLQKACQWSLRYNIPKDRLPLGVWEMQQIGVDMEWQPTFGCASTQQVALIQLAVSDQVFLLDLCARGFSHHPETINFIRSLFAEQKILKLGYGMAVGDLKCLSATWHKLLEEPLKLAGMLDLLNVHQKIQRSKVKPQNGPSEVLVGEDSAEKGLSLLVQQVLGRPLDKTEQMSNWEKRPLRITQIRYAVADAYCLLDVYSVLSSKPEQFGLPADLHSISSSQSEASADKKRKEKQGVSSTPSDTEKGLLCGKKPLEGFPPLPPQQFRVVCDSMLQGLGRYLRCLGVDVVMIEGTDDHRVAAKLAQAEGRVILTCGQPFQTLRSQVGEGRCLSLDSSEKARDQAMRILKHFNIRPTPNDIFSRCQACNSDEYVSIPQEHMTRMLKEKGDDTLRESDQQEDENLGPSVSPALPRYALRCRWASLLELDPDTLSFPGGAPIQLHTVPPGLLPRIPLFYVCTRCGKVFWEGSHFGRVFSMFQEVLQVTDRDDETAAEPAAAAAQQN